MYLAGIINQDGLVDGSMAAKSPRIEPYKRTFNYVIRAGEPLIRVTQNDVRAIQLAKAALYAGVRLLMDKLGIDTLGKIRLAGAFGSHIDVKYGNDPRPHSPIAISPMCSRPAMRGTGARIALLNSKPATRSRRWCGNREDRKPRSSPIPAAFRRGHAFRTMTACSPNWRKW